MIEGEPEVSFLPRLRVLCGVTAVAVLAYVFYDTVVVGAWMPGTLAGQAAIFCGAIALAFAPIPERRVFDVAFFYCAALSVLIEVTTALAVETAPQTMMTASVLSSVLAMGSAAMFPWGVRRQAVLSVFVAGGPLANYALVSHATSQVAPFVLVVGAVLTTGGSIVVAWQIASSREVAARRLAALRTSEEQARADATRARAFTERLPAAALTHDRNLVLTAGSGSLLTRLQLDIDRVLGTNVRDFLAFEAPEFPMVAALERALAGEAAGFEATFRDRRLLVSIEPLRDADGEISGTVSVALDVTDRADAERELRELNERLEDLVTERTARLHAVVKELEAFSYAVSHDLRQPLRTVHSFVQILEGELQGRTDETERDHLERVRVAAARMSTMLDDLLGLARLTGAETRMERVDLGQIATSLISELREAEPERNFDVSIEGDLSVWGDAGLLRLLMQNLIGNAWKFTRKSASPGLEIRGEPLDDGQVRITLVDNGVGFEPDQTSRLFRPFHRLHGDTEFEGSGIGLATVRRIVLRHGGDIEMESRGEGLGATVRLTLAADKGHARTPVI